MSLPWAELACPLCQHRQSDVISSRGSTKLGIRRRRKCRGCGYRFTTSEQIVADQAAPSLKAIEQKVRELQQLLFSLKREKPAA